MRAGTYLNDKGYPRISSGPQRGKYVHILITEGMLRRKLRKDEIVHHIDGNRKNCQWTNLLVIGERTHNAVSARQYWYLKQKFSREESAWRAYFDETNETPTETWKRQMESLGMSELSSDLRGTNKTDEMSEMPN